MIMIYLGLNTFSMLAGSLLLNIRAINSTFLHAFYTIFTLIFAELISPQVEVIKVYKLILIASFFAFQPILYLEEYGSKMNFLQQLKIKRLIEEQRNILETLPDGLIIH